MYQMRPIVGYVTCLSSLAKIIVILLIGVCRYGGGKVGVGEADMNDGHDLLNCRSGSRKC